MWNVDELRRAGEAALAQLGDYVEASRRGEGPAPSRPAPAAAMADLELRRALREGGMDADGFAAFLAAYLERSTRLHHPGSLAHQVAVPDSPAALADLIHGVINNPMALREMGAAGAVVEQVVVGWMLEQVGWDARCGRRADARRVDRQPDRCWRRVPAPRRTRGRRACPRTWPCSCRRRRTTRSRAP